MQRINLIRHVLFTGAVAAGLVAMAGSAQACSDLPNICAMNAQHHQDMVDISAGYAYGDYYGEDDYYGDDYYDSGYYSGDIDYSSYSEDPGRSLSNEAASFAGAVAAQQAELAARLQDPGFAKAYDRYVNGGWDYFQDHPGARPGEYCAAFYWRGDGMVRISGPGGDYEGALLTFWGPNIPTPGDVRTIDVTLDQADGKPQSVKAFNFHLVGDAWGAIAFAVPSIEDGLATMEDRQHFSLLIGGQTVAQVEWDGGLAAKAELERCLRRG